MHASIVLLGLSALSCVYGFPSPRIVGGRDAPEGKYPYIASLRKGGRHFCGGSIVNKKYILTAAHCVVNQQARNINVHLGTNRADEPGAVYSAEKLISNKRFSSLALNDDIALIRVIGEIQFTDKIQPIPLATENIYKAGDKAVLSGWGRLRYGGELPVKLQEIDLLIEDQKKCKRSQWRLKDTMICTFTKRGEGACNGDSGGPLVAADGKQIGIVSFGYPCAEGRPDVFTRVYSYRNWIQQNMESF